MQFKPYAKSLAVAVSLVVMAGCSSSGGTQDGSMDGTGTTAGGVSSQGMTNGQTSGSQMGSQVGIPDVRTIYFDFDKDTIRPEFESVLNAHADYLRNNPNTTVILEGHGDERGTREYNLGLGERRGNAVNAAIQGNGGSAGQISVVSYGEERPTCADSSEECWQRNRRVEIVYTTR